MTTRDDVYMTPFGTVGDKTVHYTVNRTSDTSACITPPIRNGNLFSVVHVPPDCELSTTGDSLTFVNDGLGTVRTVNGHPLEIKRGIRYGNFVIDKPIVQVGLTFTDRREIRASPAVRHEHTRYSPITVRQTAVRAEIPSRGGARKFIVPSGRVRTVVNIDEEIVGHVEIIADVPIKECDGKLTEQCLIAASISEGGYTFKGGVDFKVTTDVHRTVRALSDGRFVITPRFTGAYHGNPLKIDGNMFSCSNPDESIYYLNGLVFAAKGITIVHSQTDPSATQTYFL